MNYIFIIQLIVASLLVVSILLQQRGTALGAAFGGGSEVYTTRRGFHKKLYWSTIILGAAFIGLSILNLTI